MERKKKHTVAWSLFVSSCISPALAPATALASVPSGMVEALMLMVMVLLRKSRGKEKEETEKKKKKVMTARVKNKKSNRIKTISSYKKKIEEKSNQLSLSPPN